MIYLHPEAALKAAYQQGEVVPVIGQLNNIAVSLSFVQTIACQSQTVFLDSVQTQPQTGQFAVLGWNPWMEARCHEACLEYSFRGHAYQKTGDPLEALRALYAQFTVRNWHAELPLISGAMGYLSYDFVRSFEKVPSRAKRDLDIPDLYFIFPRQLVCWDYLNRTAYIIYLIVPTIDGDWNVTFNQAIQALTYTQEAIIFQSPEATHSDFVVEKINEELSQSYFEQMVDRVKDYIRSGDIYQANLSQRFSFHIKGSPFSVFQKLRKINPSPFSSFLQLGDLTVASCSPERLVSLCDRWCQTRPIAGTRPRGTGQKEDNQLRQDLIMSEKERAEHLMLVDLGRNDLGRVCEYDTVKVNEFMVLEMYSHVIHIVSNVCGELSQSKDMFDLIRAVFPGGTITGCPKIRCMEIIDELEPVRRNLYTGSIGYLDFRGQMDLNIVIRSLVFQGNKGYLQVGAGIVADSEPQKEYWETVQKGKALIQALMASPVIADISGENVNCG